MEIRVEMDATVWKVRVEEGDTVEAGDEIVILESMKMEVPVITERAGVVSKVVVTEGAVVRRGDLIALVDPI